MLILFNIGARAVSSRRKWSIASRFFAIAKIAFLSRQLWRDLAVTRPVRTTVKFWQTSIAVRTCERKGDGHNQLRENCKEEVITIAIGIRYILIQYGERETRVIDGRILLRWKDWLNLIDIFIPFRSKSIDGFKARDTRVKAFKKIFINIAPVKSFLYVWRIKFSVRLYF